VTPGQRSFGNRGGDRRPVGGGRDRPGAPSALTRRIDPFELFCAYYLGIGPDKRYAPANIHDVARRFGVDAGVIRQALQEHGMDPERMMNVDFDLAMAQLDIQVAPEGVDRVEIAREIFQQFRAAPHKPRDWRRLLDEDARENAKTFGRRD
jgi:transposase-like protein